MSCHSGIPYMISTSFFFQAEDGIRDVAVTGVQTCALPISLSAKADDHVQRHVEARALQMAAEDAPRDASRLAAYRSEERRVGKECRSRWSPDHYRKNGMMYRSVATCTSETPWSEFLTREQS